jgi:hypothetical protein
MPSEAILETIPGLLPRLREERDDLPGYWEHGLSVWADHCWVCGRWASIVAFSTSQHWTVTDCKRCGMVRVDMYWNPETCWQPRGIRRLSSIDLTSDN